MTTLMALQQEVVAAFIARFGATTRFDPTARRWLILEESDQWRRDDTARVVDRCRQVAREIANKSSGRLRVAAGRLRFV